MNFLTAFFEGGVGMYPILITGIILIVASIRYAIDLEPVRLRFLKALSLVLLALMLFCGMMGVVTIFEDLSSKALFGLARGLSHIVNTWGLTALIFVLASIIVAIGVYRAGRRELKALKP